MRFTPTGILLLTVGGTLVSAFQHLPTDADGLYLHGYDASGNEIKHLIDPTNPIIPEAFSNMSALANKPAPTRDPASAKLARRDYGTHCNGVQGNRDDIHRATDQMAQNCDHIGWWHWAVSYQYQSAIAYACDYGNGQNCDSNTYWSHSSAIDSACGSDRVGWFSVSDWKYSDGRTNTGTGFCH